MLVVICNATEPQLIFILTWNKNFESQKDKEIFVYNQLLAFPTKLQKKAADGTGEVLTVGTILLKIGSDNFARKFWE